MASSKPARLYPKRSWKERHEEDLILLYGSFSILLLFLCAWLMVSLEAPRLVGL